MKIFDKIPLIRFIRICRKSGGIDMTKVHHILPWILKFVIFEPLRLIELLAYNKRIKDHKISADPIFIIIGDYECIQNKE
jgi:hypothetical protein